MSRSHDLTRHQVEWRIERKHTNPKEERMKEYLVLYRNGDPSWMDRSPEETREVMAQWTEWFTKLESGGNLRNAGAALAPGGAQLRRNGDGIATDTTLSEVKELVGGFTLIKASSLDEATRLAKGSPFLHNNPKGDIVVQPVLEMDG